MKVEGPLFSFKAQNTFGRKLEFSHRHGKNFVRIHQQPTGIASAGQNDIRSYFQEATEKWQTLSSAEQGQWTTFNES